jgi:hypothetical protein
MFEELRMDYRSTANESNCKTNLSYIFTEGGGEEN